MSDRIVVMSQGQIEQQGTAKDLYYRPSSHFVGQFIGNANFLPAKLLAAGATPKVAVLGRTFDMADLGHNLVGVREGEEGRLLLRPEHLRIETGEGYGLPARVRTIIFGGASDSVSLDIGGHVLTAEHRRDAGTVLSEGDTVRVTWAPDRPILFGPQP